MRIASATSRLEEFALTRPYAIAGQEPLSIVGNVIVRIETESGLVGLGAGSPGEHRRETKKRLSASSRRTCDSSSPTSKSIKATDSI